MSLFDRMLMVARANVTDWLQNREDPEQQVTRVLQEMQGQLVMNRQAVAQAIATQKRTERQAHQAQSMADEWYRRASIAMGKGDEILAREALARRQVYLGTAQQKHAQVQQQIALVAQMRQDLQILENRLIEIRNQKEILIARSRSASATLQVNEMLDRTGNGESVRAFERLEEKVHNLEAQVEVNAELEANRLESRFAALTQEQSVEAALSGAVRFHPDIKRRSGVGKDSIGTQTAVANCKRVL
jgi:phage shock protein A